MCNRRVAIFFALMLVVSWRYSKPVKTFSIAADYPVSWCLFPFLMCSFTFLIFYWFGIIYVNSDVPFMQMNNMYQLLRTGRKKWALCQITGIILRSFVMTIMTAVCSILPFVERLDLSSGWGKLLHTAAMTDAMDKYHFEYIIYYEALVKFTPFQLMLLCVIITALCSAFIGLLMFAVSLYRSRTVAVACATTLTIALFLVLNTPSFERYKIAFFIPTIWPEIARLYVPQFGYYWLPSIKYMLTFLCLGIVLFSAVILRKTNTIEFRWENEDM